MQVRILGAVVVMLVLSGCGGGSSDQPTNPESGAPVAAETDPTSAGPTLPGVSANADLTGFVCVRDAQGSWNASGKIVNPTSTADYRITIMVAPPGVERPKAKRQILPKVKKGVATPFLIKKIPVTAGDGPSCRVQVVRFR